MTKFLVTYSSGKSQEHESSDCDTVEAFCNSHFGSTWPVAQENGATVVVLDGSEQEQEQESSQQEQTVVVLDGSEQEQEQEQESSQQEQTVDPVRIQASVNESAQVDDSF